MRVVKSKNNGFNKHNNQFSLVQHAFRYCIQFDVPVTLHDHEMTILINNM